MRPRRPLSGGPYGAAWQERVNGRQDGVKTVDAGSAALFAGAMSLMSGLLIAAVVAVAAYLLAALILPERF